MPGFYWRISLILLERQARYLEYTLFLDPDYTLSQAAS